MAKDKEKEKEKKKAKDRLTRPTEQARRKAESGEPGGGAGRIEDAGGSGVYPASGPLPEGNAPFRGEASWGQGKRGEAGFNDSGDSEITPPLPDDEKAEGREGENLGHSSDEKDAHDRRAEARKASQ